MPLYAVYPGTFDPLTLGHVDIVKRAAVLFDKMVVAVARTQRKKPYLSFENRLMLVRQVLQTIPNVEVAPLEGLLVNFAKDRGIKVLLRGLRALSDFDYEFQLAHMNRRLAPDIETVFLPAREGLCDISGTIVREIVECGGDVSAFVPEIVADFLKNHKL